MSIHCLTTLEFRALFAEEVENQSGQVTDTFDDGRRLFVRSTLPQVDEVRPRDRVQAGVALKATSEEICVYPYVFRQVCRNGAIMAHALQARRLVLADDATSDEVLLATREAVRDCCQAVVFANSVSEIRSTVRAGIDLALTVMPHLTRLPNRIVARVLDEFLGGGDSTRFGLMNAITATARDTQDPEDRWRLEELGGAVAAEVVPQPPTDSGRAYARYRDCVEMA